MPNEITEVVWYDDGKIVVMKKVVFEGAPADLIIYDQNIDRSARFIQDISFCDGVAQVFAHFTNTRWRITWNENKRCPKITVLRTKEWLKRQPVIFSDIIFILDLWVAGRSVRCDYTNECEYRVDTFPRPHWPKQKKGRAKRNRRQLLPEYIQLGAEWARRFLKDHFLPNATL